MPPPPNTIKGPVIKSRRLNPNPGLFAHFSAADAGSLFRPCRQAFIRSRAVSVHLQYHWLAARRLGLKRSVDFSALCFFTHKTLSTAAILSFLSLAVAGLRRPSANVRRERTARFIFLFLIFFSFFFFFSRIPRSQRRCCYKYSAEHHSSKYSGGPGCSSDCSNSSAAAFAMQAIV